MFRHQGKSRTLKHNLRIATILSFVAGIVNVTGFLEFKQLTTNVTGHFALFINDVAEFEVWKGTIYFLYIFSFHTGNPRIRFEIMLRFISAVPPSIELALDRSQPFAMELNWGPSSVVDSISDSTPRMSIISSYFCCCDFAETYLTTDPYKSGDIEFAV